LRQSSLFTFDKNELLHLLDPKLDLNHKEQ